MIIGYNLYFSSLKRLRRLQKSLFLLAAAFLLFSMPIAEAARDIPDNNLSYPVLINLSGGGSGSGFYVNTDANTFIVTAKHVLYETKKDEKTGIETSILRSVSASLLSYPIDPLDLGKIIISLDLKALETSGDIKKHSKHDIVLVRIGKSTIIAERPGISFCSGVVLIEKAKSGLLGVGYVNLKKFSDVLAANEVFVFGYPTSIGLKEIPQIDYSRPLLRKGIVAGVNRKTETIILDCPVYKGNSGGPVLEVERDGFENKFRIIGVVTDYIPFAERWENKTQGYWNMSISNSGYSIAAPADAVIELINEY